MKKNYTHLILVLDESGSMSPLTNGTIEGVNSLVKTQKEQPGDFTTALYKFNGQVQEVKGFEELNNANYFPLGSTSLFDAICKAVDGEGRRLAQLKESERPDKVVMVVVTDGEENSSTEYTLANVKERVATQRDKYSWEFVFLGANIDAFRAGAAYGISATSTMQWTPTYDGVTASYAAVGSTLTSYRAGHSTSMNLGGASNGQGEATGGTTK